MVSADRLLAFAATSFVPIVAPGPSALAMIGLGVIVAATGRKD